MRILLLSIFAIFIYSCGNNVDYEIAGIDAENETIRVYLKDPITDTNLVKDIADHIYYKNKSAILAANPDPVQISVTFFISKESASLGGLNTTFLYSYIVKQGGEKVIFNINQSLLDILNKKSANYDSCKEIHKYFATKDISMCNYLKSINDISKTLSANEGIPDKVLTKEELFKQVDKREELFGIELKKLNEKYNIDPDKGDIAVMSEFDCGCIDIQY